MEKDWSGTAQNVFSGCKVDLFLKSNSLSTPYFEVQLPYILENENERERIWEVLIFDRSSGDAVIKDIINRHDLFMEKEKKEKEKREEKEKKEKEKESEEEFDDYDSDFDN